MSYSCTDAYSDLITALRLKTPKAWDDDGCEHVSEETDLALAEIVRLQRGASKAGIRRIKPLMDCAPEIYARPALQALREALRYARNAGSCYTAARIEAAISSAKGALRAAVYRRKARP